MFLSAKGSSTTQGRRMTNAACNGHSIFTRTKRFLIRGLAMTASSPDGDNSPHRLAFQVRLPSARRAAPVRGSILMDPPLCNMMLP